MIESLLMLSCRLLWLWYVSVGLLLEWSETVEPPPPGKSQLETREKDFFFRRGGRRTSGSGGARGRSNSEVMILCGGAGLEVRLRDSFAFTVEVGDDSRSPFAAWSNPCWPYQWWAKLIMGGWELNAAAAKASVVPSGVALPPFIAENIPGPWG